MPDVMEDGAGRIDFDNRIGTNSTNDQASLDPRSGTTDEDFAYVVSIKAAVFPA